MTALTDHEFHAELDAIRADTDALGLPAAYAVGECDTCGTDGPVRITPEGLTCDDCYEADPRPYDPSDEHDYLNDDWSRNR